MTVAELIQMLSECQPDSHVTVDISGDDDGTFEGDRVVRSVVGIHRNKIEDNEPEWVFIDGAMFQSEDDHANQASR
jgi:hypothetical protein